MFDVDKIIEKMSVEQICGQVLAYDLQPSEKEESLLAEIEQIRAGELFFCDFNTVKDFAEQKKLLEQHKKYVKLAEKCSGFPVMTLCDVENGPGSYSGIYEELPHPMAWGACNDETLIEEAGRLTGRISRRLGIHYALAPVVDLNLNFRNPLVNIRAISDDPDRVIRIARAYIVGMQENGYLGACIKHFPGDGTDDRNQHFLTTVNSLSKEEWLKTYGKIYKALFKVGVEMVMVGHISCPAFQPDEKDAYGALPGTLSKNLMSDLLKGELGFKGCIISDAMSMIGACARVPLDRLATEFFKAGGDMMLFPEPEDGERLISAVKRGEIPLERMKDAARRCLNLKNKIRLYEDEQVQRELGDGKEDAKKLRAVADKIAEKSVKIVRNDARILPVKGKKNDKALILTMIEPYFNKESTGEELSEFVNEIKNRGYQTEVMTNAKHKTIKDKINDYDLVIVCCKMSSLDYHGATLRVGWNNIMAFWRGYAFKNENFVFVSFGDPYKLYDFPYLKTYINAFGYSKASQRAVAKLIFGEIECTAKNPVNFGEYFLRED